MMRLNLGKAVWFGVAPLLLVSAAALGGEGVDIRVTNDSTQDILVTVYDTSIEPRTAVLSHLRINGFTTIPLQVSPDASGRANLTWSAVSVDTNDRRCGQADAANVADSSSINVHADSECST